MKGIITIDYISIIWIGSRDFSGNVFILIVEADHFENNVRNNLAKEGEKSRKGR